MFKEEILKYEVLDSQTADILLNRYISHLTKRRFFNESFKRKYYSFWFKILVGSGYLIPKGMGYQVRK